MRFDISGHYLLLQAFDLTGRKVFGAKWRGDEAFARDAEDPSRVSGERQNVQNRIKTLAASTAPHNAILASDADEEEHQAASDALHHINQELGQLKERLATLPHLTGAWLADHETFKRRMDIEGKLFEAFLSGDLDLQVGPYEIVQWRNWSRQPDFKVLFSMSCVIVPRSHADQRRRGPAFIERVAFNKWLNRFAGAATETHELTPEGQLEGWLREKVKGPKESSKAVYKAQALEEIPELSARAFDRIWDNVVPENWKRRGRPSA